MPFCHNCGAKLEPGDMFCVACGTPSKEFKSEKVNDAKSDIIKPQEDVEAIKPVEEEPVKAATVIEVKPEPVIESAPEVTPEPEPVVETKHPEPEPDIEEIPLETTDENFYVDLTKPVEDKHEVVSEQKVKSSPVSKTDPDYVKGKETETVKEDKQPKQNLIPILVTICGICLAVVIALTFAILIILKKANNDKKQKPSEPESSYFSETSAPETTTNLTTTESSTEETSYSTEDTEDDEDPDETEEAETTASAKSTTAAKRKFKVSNQINKKLDAAQYGTYVYKVPKITIDGLNTDEANKKMKDDLSQYLDVSGEPYQVTHTHYSNKNFVVILVSYGKHSPPTMTRTYTISLKTGKIMTGSEIVKIYGITDKHFFKQVRTTYSKCSSYGTDDKTIREKNLKRVSFKYITPYISKQGHLCFVAYCDFLSGDGTGYLNFDATAKKMLS